MTGVHPVLDQTRELLSAALAGCSAQQITQHPAGDPTRWSAQQVVEHLSATWRLTTHSVEDRLRKGRPLQTKPTPAQRVMQWATCELGYFPKGRKAPPAVLPVADADAPAGPPTGDELIARISTTLAAMDRALNRIEPTAGGQAVVTHIVLGPLNVRRWRRFHRTHARHHVQQIRNATGKS